MVHRPLRLPMCEFPSGRCTWVSLDGSRYCSRHRYLESPCSYCGASVDQFCTTDGGKVATNCHESRVRAYFSKSRSSP